MIRYAAILLLWFVFAIDARGQSLDLAKAKIEHFDTMLEQNKLSEKAYLDSVTTWRWAQLTSGVLFEAGILIDYLKNYKAIAWSSDQFAKNRINYYEFLATNASMQVRSGEALYFYGKLEQELERATGNKSLYQLSEQCAYYMFPEYYDKIIAAYEKARGYEVMQSYPAKIKSGEIDTITAFRYIYVAAPVSFAYARLGDTANFDKMVRVAKSIGQELIKKIAVTSTWAFTIKFETDNLDFYRSLYLENNVRAALAILYKQNQYVAADTLHPANWKAILGQKVHENLIETHLTAAQYDSAAYLYRDSGKV